MQCPFLKETLVESCRHSLVRKLIARTPENLELERCSSPAFTDCQLYTGTFPGEIIAQRCPYLDETLAQYCAAAPVPKFIPFSEAVLSRCGSEAHRYCDLYVSMAHPPEAEVPDVDGIPVPQWLHYAPNHLWLDKSEDDVCHIGVDALMARVLGCVDRITYLTTRGVHHPAVVLAAGGHEFHLVFPNRMLITAANVYLRANPARVTSDPYRQGWLFECRPVPDQPGSSPIEGLHAGGEQANRWMRSEYERLGAFIHAQAGVRGAADDVLVADGGNVAPGVVEHLDRDQAARLHYAFFSPASLR
jgi:glycine cleavage system H lipoate-binding protein